jgi:hypothetical protein
MIRKLATLTLAGLFVVVVALSFAPFTGDGLVDAALTLSLLPVVGMPLNIKSVADASDITTKMLKNSGNAGQDWLQGVLNPSASFVAAGIKAKEKHKTETQKALNEDRYAKGLAKVNIEDVIATINKVGVSAYTNGISAREPQIRAAFEKLVPLLREAKAKLDAMPVATDADREKKMLENLRLMREIGARMRG